MNNGPSKKSTVRVLVHTACPSASAYPRFTLPLVLATCCLLLTGGSDHPNLDTRRQSVEKMTPSQKLHLQRLWERFEAIPPEQRENIRQLERQISQNEHAQELKEVMHRYYQWCRTLPVYQRLELLELPVKQRITKIKELKRQSEDAEGLKKWLKAKADHLTAQQQKRLSKPEANDQRRQLIRWMGDMTKKSGKDPNNPLTDQDLADLRSHLSAPTRQALLKKTSPEQWKTIVDRLKRHFRSRFNRRRFMHPSGISNEELAARFQNLPLKRQDELLSLPAEEMQQQLQQIHMNHNFPKFRPLKPGNHPHRRPQSKQRSPKPHSKAASGTTP